MPGNYKPKSATKGKKPYKPYKPKTQKAVNRQVKKNSMILNQGGKPIGPVKFYVREDPFRPYYSANMHYTQTLAFTSGVAGIYGTEQIWRLNSLYDPDLSGTGHQPYGHAQLSALYRNYKVNGVTCIIDVYDPDNDGVIVAMQWQSANGTSTITGKAVDVIKEQPMSITRNISDSGKQRLTIKQYFPMHTLLGVTPLQYKASIATEFIGNTGGFGTGTSPSQIPYLRMAIAHLSLAGVKVNIRTTLIYHSQYFNRIVQAQS